MPAAPYITRLDTPQPDLIYRDEVARSLVIYDVTEREMNLRHFAGTETMTLSLRYSAHREYRLNRGTARTLAHVFDHFARHGNLPVTFKEPDYEI